MQKKLLIYWEAVEGAVSYAVTAEYAISFTATEAGTYTYTFTYTDSFGNEYTIATVNFIATEILYTLGDLNDDGIVDNLDSVLILKYDAGLSDLSETQLLAGDVNGDGTVDNLDSVRILKYDAGLSNTL